jgi:hypothetical protein
LVWVASEYPDHSVFLLSWIGKPTLGALWDLCLGRQARNFLTLAALTKLPTVVGALNIPILNFSYRKRGALVWAGVVKANHPSVAIPEKYERLF